MKTNTRTSENAASSSRSIMRFTAGKLFCVAFFSFFLGTLLVTAGSSIEQFRGQGSQLGEVARQEKLLLEGKNFIAVQLKDGSPRGTGFEIRSDLRGRSIVTTSAEFSAKNYDEVRAQFSGIGASSEVLFYWRSTSNPGQLAYTKLERQKDSTFALQLSGIDQWDGKISEVAIGILDDLAEPVLLAAVSLYKHSPPLVLKSQARDWLLRRSWTPSSVNVLFGSSDTLSPAVFLGLSFCVSAILLLLACWRMRLQKHLGLLVLFSAAISWIALDLLWLNRLLPQSVETFTSSSSKTLRERKLTAPDGKIFELVDAAKRYYLPTSRQQISIATTQAPRFLVDRALYHLLPEHQPALLMLERDQQRYERLVSFSDYILFLQVGMQGSKDPKKLLRSIGLRETGRETFVVASLAGALFKIEPLPARAPR